MKFKTLYESFGSSQNSMAGGSKTNPDLALKKFKSLVGSAGLKETK